MIKDITQLSDDELKSLANVDNSPNNDITKLSDDELKQASSKLALHVDNGITGQDIAQHPFQSIGKTIMRPALENLTGKTAEQIAREKSLNDAENIDFKGMNPYEVKNKLGDIEDSSFKNVILGQVADVLTTPANYAGVPVAKAIGKGAMAIGKSVPEGLKQGSYALMQSIVNQLPKEFKYGANAGRAIVKEGLQGDASDIADQSSAKIKEIGKEGDKLASTSNTPIDNNNAIKVIDDKISELQKNAPRENASTITRLQNAKKDLLGVTEDSKGNIIDQETDTSSMTPKESLDFKRKYDYLTQWKGTVADDSIVNSTLQQSRRAVKDNLNNAIPGMKEWNQRYADLSAANQAAMRRVTYDQAGAGMRNVLNNFVRGSVGMSTLGAALTGHGELAGEILAGWGAKEVLGNPMVKSKIAQMLYGASELDKSAIFKAVPWAKNAINSYNKSPIYLDNSKNINNNSIKSLAIGAGGGGAIISGSNNANASTIGQDNNNPINLKAFDKWDGMTGKDKYGHAIFPDIEHGIRAGLKNLNTHQRNNPNQSLNDYLNTFAEKNGSSEANYIARKMNINSNTKLKDLNMGKVLIHLAKIESKTDITPNDIIKVKLKYKIK